MGPGREWKQEEGTGGELHEYEQKGEQMAVGSCGALLAQGG